MKCRYCKAEIPEGELYCKKCGREVQIVPDYNPLEEMLTAQIQLDGNEQESEFNQYINQKRRNNNRTGQSAGEIQVQLDVVQEEIQEEVHHEQQRL